MSGYPRAEIEEMIELFMEANREAEEKKDWSKIGDFYTDDAKYAWSVSQDEEALVVGRENIQRIVLGLEMDGLDEDAWTYPYQHLMIDEKQSEVIGFYRYFSGKRRPDGSIYEAVGIHGSWFHYAGNFKWDWQRDFLDYGNLRELFSEMITDGAIGPRLLKRLQNIQALKAEGKLVEGHFKRGTGPFQLWDLAPGVARYEPPKG